MLPKIKPIFHKIVYERHGYQNIINNSTASLVSSFKSDKETIAVEITTFSM